MEKRESKTQDWIACVILTVVGLGFIAFVIFTTPAPVKEAELLSVQGIATDAKIATPVELRNKRELSFKIKGYHFAYRSNEKDFKKLVEAIRGENELTIFVHPSPPPPVFDTPTKIYGISVNGQEFLKFSEATAGDFGGLLTLYSIGTTMVLCGVTGGAWYYRRSRKPSVEES